MTVPMGSGSEAISVTPWSIVSYFSPVRRSRRFTSVNARSPAATSASALCSITSIRDFPPLTPFREGERTAMSSPLALRITSLFASSSFQISSRARVRSAEVTNWGASKAALALLAVWVRASAPKTSWSWTRMTASSIGSAEIRIDCRPSDLGYLEMETYPRRYPLSPLRLYEVLNIVD